jgi:hypothetical protein
MAIKITYSTNNALLYSRPPGEVRIARKDQSPETVTKNNHESPV